MNEEHRDIATLLLERIKTHARDTDPENLKEAVEIYYRFITAVMSVTADDRWARTAAQFSAASEP